MNYLRRNGLAVGLTLALALAFGLSLWGVRPSTQPVLAAVITPVAQTARGDARIAEFFVSRAITEDTRVCFDLADMELMDLQYQVDATDANTTTVTVEQTNIDPTSGPFNSANAIATVVDTDADLMTQVPLFGRWNCVYADVTNSNPVTLTVIGVAK